MQNGYGGIDTLTVFPVLYRSFFHFSEQTPVLLDAELGFVDTLIATQRVTLLFWCGQQDSNLHALAVEPKSTESTNSTMPAWF